MTLDEIRREAALAVGEEARGAAYEALCQSVLSGALVPSSPHADRVARLREWHVGCEAARKHLLRLCKDAWRQQQALTKVAPPLPSPQRRD